MITICGKEYYVDIDVFFDTFTGTTLNENDVNTVITATYGDDDGTQDLSLISKEVVESRRNGIDTLYTLRYDTIKFLLDTLLQPTYNEVGELRQIKTLGDLPFAQQIAFNSLLNRGIIKEKTSN